VVGEEDALARAADGLRIRGGDDDGDLLYAADVDVAPDQAAAAGRRRRLRVAQQAVEPPIEPVLAGATGCCCCSVAADAQQRGLRAAGEEADGLAREEAVA
jgi:hypothetical protein